MYDYMNRARPLSEITTLVSLIFLIILWELSPGLNRNGGQRKTVCTDKLSAKMREQYSYTGGVLSEHFFHSDF